MAFARKAKKKKQGPPNILPKKSRTDLFFSTLAPIFSRKHRYFLPSVPHFLEQLRCKYEQHRLPVKHEEAVNRNGGNHRPIRARVSRFQKTFFTLHRRPQPTKWQTFTGEGF